MLNLLRYGAYSCGTMRSDRKGFSSTLKTIVKRGFPNRGDFVTAQNGIVSTYSFHLSLSYALHL